MTSGPTWIPGGSYRVLYEYANGLADRGHDVTLVFPSRLRQRSIPRTGAASIVHRLREMRRRWKNRRPTWFLLDPRVRTLHVTEPTDAAVPEADVVFATSWMSAEYVAEYPPAKGHKAYLIYHNDVESGHPPDRVEATWALPMTRLFISRWVYERAERGRLSPNYYVPSGVNVRTYQVERPIDRREARVAMSYVPKIGKDVTVGLAALEMARQRHPELRATLFGSVRRDRALPEWIEYRRRPSDREVAAEIYNRAGVFLCSSRVEGFGLPGLEAMACGCALVSTDCGGVREYAEHGETALLSPVGDTAALAANLCAVLADADTRVRLATTGSERARQLTWERTVERLEGVLEQMRAGPPSAAAPS